MGCHGSTQKEDAANLPTKPLTSAERLEKLGYEFRKGRLVQLGTDKGFEFRDQKHYDALADVVLSHVGVLLEEEAGLKAIKLPMDTEVGPFSVVYTSNAFEVAKKLLLIIQGGGRVRVGVWGCALCINKDLQQGSILPYLEKAKIADYGVIVLNPNENRVDGKEVLGSETEANHIAYVWEHIVTKMCPTSAIVDVVAHSNGGRALLEFLGGGNSVSTVAARRIRRIVFTDSYHSYRDVQALDQESKEVLADSSRVVNYVPAPAPLGEPVAKWVSLGNHMSQHQKACQCVSAASEDHASTNYAAMGAAFDFFAR